jgi:hypothetical protein
MNWLNRSSSMVQMLSLAEHPELEIYRTLPYSRAVTGLAVMKPYIFLMGATPVDETCTSMASALKGGLDSWLPTCRLGIHCQEKPTYKTCSPDQASLWGNITPRLSHAVPKWRPLAGCDASRPDPMKRQVESWVNFEPEISP